MWPRILKIFQTLIGSHGLYHNHSILPLWHKAMSMTKFIKFHLWVSELAQLVTAPAVMSDYLNSTPGLHKLGGEEWLHKVVLWPSHRYHCTHPHTPTYPYPIIIKKCKLPVIPELRRLRQKNTKFKANLYFIVITHQKRGGGAFLDSMTQLFIYKLV